MLNASLYTFVENQKQKRSFNSFSNLLCLKLWNYLQSDIWAMGVCVYEMTTLKRPFDACLQQQLFLKIANHNDQVTSRKM